MIKEIDVYHPEKMVANDYYVDHFKKQGRDITEFLKAMGKQERFIIENEEENGLTMAIEVAKNALKKANMSGKDIDYILYTSQVPEVTFPSSAMYVHDAIGASAQAMAMDMNANCAGMTVGVDQASRYLLANPNVKTALVIGSDHLSLISNPEQEITYATYGDAACAVILEKTEEDTGFIDSKYHIMTKNVDKIRFPEAGLAKTLKGQSNDKFVRFERFDASFGMPIAFQLIDDILEANQLQIDDIKAFCISQFAYGDTTKIKEHFNIAHEKMVYIGDRMGYTGTSSPFIALHEGIKDGRIKRGDHVLFWTVGGGHQFISMLFKY